jgi:hypothetical protein
MTEYPWKMLAFSLQVVRSILTAPRCAPVDVPAGATQAVRISPTPAVLIIHPTAEELLPRTMGGLDDLDNDACLALAVQVTATALLNRTDIVYRVLPLSTPNKNCMYSRDMNVKVRFRENKDGQ